MGRVRIGAADIACTLLSACSEQKRLEIGVALIAGLRDPELAIEMMAAGRHIHDHGVQLSRVAFDLEGA
jgi:hypothetical protein